MIIGIVLNNFKCYKGMHYIPLTNADGANHCGLIGLNGVGKSAVLEALDCIFNEKDFLQTISNGNNENSYVIPICSFDENELSCLLQFVSRPKETQRLLELISITFKRHLCSNLCHTQFDMYRQIVFDMKEFLRVISNNTMIFPLVPLNIELSCLAGCFGINMYTDDDIEKLYDIMYECINSVMFIYLPSNIASEDFEILEAKQIMRLLGAESTIQQVVNREIASELYTTFDREIKKLSNCLTDYNISTSNTESFRLTRRKINIHDLDMAHLIPKYQLVRLVCGINVPFSQLSSGEKQQAIIDVIYQIVKSKPNKCLIIAVDEPESSFHISERFEQFNKLYEISRKCGQVLFASHWYGFIPAMPDGCVVNIFNDNGKRTFQPIDIYKYKEDISRAKMPIDISMKGSLDLVQTIVSSILLDNCYNWLICEGTSDKIYLDEYLKDEIKDIKLRIIPVGGCSIVEKINKLLLLLLSDNVNLDEIKGKIFLLIDTDANPTATKETQNETPKPPKHIKDLNDKNKLWLRRLLNIEKAKKTILTKGIQTKDDLPTDIEGVLNGKVFNMVLNQFKEELSFDVSDEEKSENIPSAFLYLEDFQKKALKAFFSPHNKVRFACEYVKEIQKGGYKEPSWIAEIKKFFRA